MKEKNASFLLNQKNKLETVLFYSLLLLLPTQLGKHFWPDFSFVKGIPVDYLSPTLYLTDIILLLLFAVWFLNRVRQRLQRVQFPAKDKKIIPKSFLFYFFFCLYLISSSVFSDRPVGSLYSVGKFVEMSFLVYYVSREIRVQQVLSSLVVLCIGAIGESLLALGQFLNQGSIGGIFYFLGERSFTSSTPGIANVAINGELLMRPYGTFPHPNVLAGYLLIVLIMTLFLFRQFFHRWQQSIGVIVLLLGTGSLLLTLSRVAIVVWFLVLAAGFIITQQRVFVWLKNTSIRAVLSLCILGGGIVVILASPLGTRLMQTSFTEEALVQREILINSTIEISKATPLFGVGPGNFLPALATVQQPLSLGLYMQPVHNILLLVFSELGLVGFSFFFIYLLQTYRRLLKWYHLGNSDQLFPLILFLVLSAILFLGSFDHYWLTIQQGQLLFAFVLGLSWITIPLKSKL